MTDATDDASEQSMAAAVGAGDVVREQWPRPDEDRINLYLGSGRAGACFDAYGLMNDGDGEPGIGTTALSHADHWHRDEETGMDVHLPVARLGWADEVPGAPEQYRQALSVYDGHLETECTWPDCRLALRSYCHPGEDYRDLLAVEVRHEGPLPSLALSVVEQVETNVGTVAGSGERTGEAAGPDQRINRVRAGTADSALGIAVETVSGDAALAATDDQITVDFESESGHHLLVLGTTGWDRREELRAALDADRAPEQFAADAARAWHDRWGDSYVDVPVPEYQAFWARSLYYVFASYAPEVRCPAPPHGWTGNNWGYSFPQDLSYLHPALLRHGHTDIPSAWVEFFHERIDQTRAWTERVWGVEGTMWEWEYPIGPTNDRPYPNDALDHEKFHFQIHNAAYPARMAYETARYRDDSEWAREVAWPVVRGSTRFYAGLLDREDGGRWGLDVDPAMGQDELGERDAKNYLCSLFSARYCLQAALGLVEDLGVDRTPEVEQWAEILDDGLAFERVLPDEDGVYVTNEGVDPAEMTGELKHPVQLNPLTFLPLGDVDEPTRRAYEMRDRLCLGMTDDLPHSSGWTLPAFTLAASHLGDDEGLLRELGRWRPSTLADDDWIQCYESSLYFTAPYYATSHGLYLQALADAFVSDYWDEVRIGDAVPDSWADDAAFRNLHTESRVFSGTVDDVTSQPRSR